MKDRLNNFGLQQMHSKALVEAGHFYADKPVGPEHRLGIQVGQAAITALNELGIQTATCFLIDDYNEPDRYSALNLGIYADWGFVPDCVYREMDMVFKAETILMMLKDANRIKETRDGSIHLKDSSFTRLVDNNRRTNPLSCALLDSALYMTKHQQHNGLCVTVLPERFGSQQAATRRILQQAGLNIPILNIYHDSNGLARIDI